MILPVPREGVCAPSDVGDAAGGYTIVPMIEDSRSWSPTAQTGLGGAASL
jgi:hypothetical protein